MIVIHSIVFLIILLIPSSLLSVAIYFLARHHKNAVPEYLNTWFVIRITAILFVADYFALDAFEPGPSLLWGFIVATFTSLITPFLANRFPYEIEDKNDKNDRPNFRIRPA